VVRRDGVREHVSWAHPGCRDGLCFEKIFHVDG
jgi:hypothetical protein